MNPWQRKQQYWLEIMKAKGHSPRLDEEGTIELFSYAEDIHNGPMCDLCFDSTCIHCDPEGKYLGQCNCIEGTLAFKAIEVRREGTD